MSSIPLSCLVVEDEPLAATVIEDFIKEIPWLHFAGRCSNAVQAAEVLESQLIDVLFLDIHLPGIKGLDFLRGLEHPPQTILTTAYNEYAVAGYELNVTDYLLKPIGFERFFQAIQKLRRPDQQKSNRTSRPFHFFNSNKKMVRVWLDEIALVESMREYVRIHLVNGSYVVTKYQLSALEEMLQPPAFLRIHRSFIVGKAHIEALTSTEITVADKEIPVGRQYKEVVEAAMRALTD